MEIQPLYKRDYDRRISVTVEDLADYGQVGEGETCYRCQKPANKGVSLGTENYSTCDTCEDILAEKLVNEFMGTVDQ